MLALACCAACTPAPATSARRPAVEPATGVASTAPPASASTTPLGPTAPASAEPASAAPSSKTDPFAPPDWVAHPFADLPDLAPSAPSRPLEVSLVVVRRKRAAGTITSPLLLRIPALGLEREIFDDAMVQPACETQSDVRTNALFVYCRGMDGAVKLRVHQRANTLVLEVARAGDAPALTQGETIELPPGRIVQFRTRPPTEQRNNPGVGVVLESR